MAEEMRRLLYTPGSPFARAVRIVLDELGLVYEGQELTANMSIADTAGLSPTLQVPAYWDNSTTLWESGLIVEYLLSSCDERPDTSPPLAQCAFRSDAEWLDRLTYATIQTFGISATTISQLTWTGVTVANNDHIKRSAVRLEHILAWLETSLMDTGPGFMPGCVSMQDIFLACHVRFMEARPLDVDLKLSRYGRVENLVNMLDERTSFQANPVWWWEPGVIGHELDGTPVFTKDTEKHDRTPRGSDV